MKAFIKALVVSIRKWGLSITRRLTSRFLDCLAVRMERVAMKLSDAADAVGAKV